MAKDFITQETSSDFSAAESYGEIVFVTNDDMNNTRGSLHNEDLLRQIRMTLHKFNQKEDFIIIAGSPYVAGMVFMVLGRKGHDSIKFLRWSNCDRVYTPVTIEFNHRDEESLHG